MTYDIHCRDCGGPYRARRRDAQSCPPCRMVRLLTYATARWTRPRACAKCAARYRPHRTQKFRLCPACDGHRVEPDVECVICKETRERVAYGVPACLACATSPTWQATTFAALKRGQKARREKYLTPSNPKEYAA